MYVCVCICIQLLLATNLLSVYPLAGSNRSKSQAWAPLSVHWTPSSHWPWSFQTPWRLPWLPQSQLHSVSLGKSPMVTCPNALTANLLQLYAPLQSTWSSRTSSRRKTKLRSQFSRDVAGLARKGHCTHVHIRTWCNILVHWNQLGLSIYMRMCISTLYLFVFIFTQAITVYGEKGYSLPVYTHT